MDKAFFEIRNEIGKCFLFPQFFVLKISVYPILIKWYSKSKQTLEKIVIVLPKKDRSETMHCIRITKENIDKVNAK